MNTAAVSIFAVIGFLAAVSLSSAMAPEPQVRLIKITELMTVEEFKTTGMTKLTPDEMRQLDAWLNRYSIRLAKTVSEREMASQRVSEPAVIETRIDGEFNGWDGDTVFKLENGQIWQQTSYDYEYHYAYRPEVLIYKSGGVYKMKVEDMDDAITVRRLK